MFGMQSMLNGPNTINLNLNYENNMAGRFRNMGFGGGAFGDRDGGTGGTSGVLG